MSIRRAPAGFTDQFWSKRGAALVALLMVSQGSAAQVGASIDKDYCALLSEKRQSLYGCEAPYIFQGFEVGDHRGGSLADEGDWNGGGRADILAGSFSRIFANSPGYPAESSVALWLGETVQPCEGFPLFRIEGDSLSDGFGRSVDFVGDIDGDGKDDFVVGAPNGPTAPPNPPLNPFPSFAWEGRVYVFLSSDVGAIPAPPYSDLNPAPTANGYASLILSGQPDDGMFGYSVSRAGDFDGDGIPDVLIGSPGLDSRTEAGLVPTTKGRAYLVSGADIRALVATQSGQELVVTNPVALPRTLGWQGTSENDKFGLSVSNGGDIDFDGNPDLIVGAPQWYWALGMGEPDGISTGPGYVRLVMGAGAATGQIKLHTIEGTQYSGVTKSGEWFGHAVGGAVDVDSVPGAEVLVGSPRYDEAGLTDAGRAQVFTWGGRNPQDPMIDLGPDFRPTGGSANEYFGWSVCGIGRFDCDEFMDWAVGARNFGTAGRQNACLANCLPGDTTGGDTVCGRMWVYRGVDGSVAAVYTGEDAKDSLGWAIARIGDFDGSPLGLDDVLTSGMRWPGPPLVNTPEFGRVYLFTR